ncbi:2-dehydropantoate 2-reductase [Nocardia sp. NPDC046473]|uniref:ketopantoate reductase family protein n=1 Tax=Nocardia sp. NPDC046473 TaxID=3155733 RepID=UPI00340AEC3B
MDRLEVLVIGAGVIGRIYACRLARCGHQVTVLARGATSTHIAAEGITLHEGAEVSNAEVRVVDAANGERYDLIMIAVRYEQRAGAIESAARAAGGLVVPLFNNPLGLGPLRDRFGADRVVGVFPGVGGYLEADGSVRYHRIRQQPTTVARNHGREQAVVHALTDAGFAVAVTDDMDGWLATHAVFVVAVSAALERAGYSIARLTGDRAAMTSMVRAIRSGFDALRNRGITVSPAGLRIIFTRVPVTAAAWYWRRTLRGPLGSVAIVPHARATRNTEMAALRADVAKLIPRGAAPEFDRLVGPLG